jgi:SIR2-like domain
MTTPAELDDHFVYLLPALEDGSLVPLLGAGVNMSGRTSAWSQGTSFLPSGDELARYLAAKFKYEYNDPKELELIRVSQFVALKGSSKGLYRELHSVFSGAHEPGAVHKLLAALPGTFEARGEKPRYQLIMTTNYDRALEAAFDAAGERYHLLLYLSEGQDRGRFVHRAPDGATKLIDDPNKNEVSMEDCTVIVKIHGSVGDAPGADSYVITEDDYLDYLMQSTDITNLFPVHLAAHLTNDAQFLFLGYKLRDWNLRVILNRIWQEQQLSGKSWAIQLKPEALDLLFWRRHEVDILDVELDEYVRELRVRLGIPEPVEPAVGTGA